MNERLKSIDRNNNKEVSMSEALDWLDIAAGEHITKRVEGGNHALIIDVLREVTDKRINMHNMQTEGRLRLAPGVMELFEKRERELNVIKDRFYPLGRVRY